MCAIASRSPFGFRNWLFAMRSSIDTSNDQVRLHMAGQIDKKTHVPSFHFPINTPSRPTPFNISS